MLVLITLLALATLLALVAHIAAGRFIGLSVATLCTTTMAFFLMPPVLSLRVSQSSDMFALAFYGVAELVIVRLTPPRGRLRKTKLAGLPADAPRKFRHQPDRTDLREALNGLMLSDLGRRLQTIEIDVASEGLAFLCTAYELRSILSDLLMTALATPGVRRIAVFGGRRPGIRRLIVVAHYSWPPPQGKVIAIGKRDQDCETVTFAGWPPGWRASWFDNGYDRIYQVTANDEG